MVGHGGTITPSCWRANRNFQEVSADEASKADSEGAAEVHRVWRARPRAFHNVRVESLPPGHFPGVAGGTASGLADGIPLGYAERRCTGLARGTKAYPGNRAPHFPNPNGVVYYSPGLRGTRYPGKSPPTGSSTPTGLCPRGGGRCAAVGRNPNGAGNANFQKIPKIRPLEHVVLGLRPGERQAARSADTSHPKPQTPNPVPNR
jgi:hypothetical protein